MALIAKLTFNVYLQISIKTIFARAYRYHRISYFFVIFFLFCKQYYNRFGHAQRYSLEFSKMSFLFFFLIYVTRVFYVMFQHGVGVEFIRFLPETHPPALSNIFCELGVCENIVSILRAYINIRNITKYK